MKMLKFYFLKALRHFCLQSHFGPKNQRFRRQSVQVYGLPLYISIYVNSMIWRRRNYQYPTAMNGTLNGWLTLKQQPFALRPIFPSNSTVPSTTVGVSPRSVTGHPTIIYEKPEVKESGNATAALYPYPGVIPTPHCLFSYSNKCKSIYYSIATVSSRHPSIIKFFFSIMRCIIWKEEQIT